MSIYQVPKKQVDKMSLKTPRGITPQEAVKKVGEQMRVEGSREKTIEEYAYHFMKFVSFTGLESFDDLEASMVYDWLNSMNVKMVTKQSRLKMLKAFLTRCYRNKWVKENFWHSMRIKVDVDVKAHVPVERLDFLCSQLDTSRFVGLRDVVAIRLIQYTGIRINTLVNLQEHHVKIKEKELHIPGEITKNRKPLVLPIPDMLIDAVHALIEVNKAVKGYYLQEHSYLFTTERGRPGNGDGHISRNPISKQLRKYSEKYNIEGLSPHAIRRTFATNLLKKGASVALISKALGHSDLKTTTQYLDLELQEVSQSLREYF